MIVGTDNDQLYLECLKFVQLICGDIKEKIIAVVKEM